MAQKCKQGNVFPIFTVCFSIYFVQERLGNQFSYTASIGNFVLYKKVPNGYCSIWLSFRAIFKKLKIEKFEYLCASVYANK